MRLPFDPDRVLGASPEDVGPPEAEAGSEEAPRLPPVAPAGPKPRTVSQAVALIKSTLEEHVEAPLRVVGEISNLSAQHHWYFSLKDEAAVLSCVAWASSARKFAFRPQVGQEVVATGHISHYGPQGRTQLYVSDLEPLGAGALELRFRALCDELRGLGYFDEARKKPVPAFPGRIAVITSAGGAAVHDVIATAAERCRAVGIVVVDVRVQGEGASEQVAAAIRWVDARRAELGVDALLVTRGGGSMEDLWAFNERPVADAVFDCTLPVVAAIGHESDTTIIELVADLRAATPTQAAVRLVPSAVELNRQVDHLSQRLLFVVARGLELQRQRLTTIARHEAFRDPALICRRARETLVGLARSLHRIIGARISRDQARLERLAWRLARLGPQVVLWPQRERVAVLADRLARAMGRLLEGRPRVEALGLELQGVVQRHVRRFRDRLDALERQLSSVDPDRVLQRGYSYTHRPDGRIVRSVDDVALGDQMLTRVADGSIESIVARAKRGPEHRPRGERSRSQMDLFTPPQ